MDMVYINPEIPQVLAEQGYISEKDIVLDFDFVEDELGERFQFVTAGGSFFVDRETTSMIMDIVF